MATNRRPAAVPGDNTPIGKDTEDLQKAVVSEGLRAETAEQKADRLERELAEVKALVNQLGKNHASASAAPAELPSLDAVMKEKPDVPVLTRDGWYVPEVHPTDRLAKA